MGGVLPYTSTNPYTGAENNGLWVLVGKEKGGGDKGTWDMFSGKADATDPTLAYTAAREAAEESCELLGKIGTIQQNMFPLGGSKSSFLLKISDPRQITPDTFKARKREHRYSKGCFQEKSSIKWVKLADLIDACANKKGVLSTLKEDMQIRPYFARVINKNKDFLANKINNTVLPKIKENNVIKIQNNNTNKINIEKKDKIPEVITNKQKNANNVNNIAVPKIQTIDICKTPIEKLNRARINPFEIDFIENGKKRTAQAQAQEIINYIGDFFKKNNEKIAITYSSNSQQAEDIYAGYKNGKYSIEGSNQAEVFSIVAKEIQKRGWEDGVHILPIPTCEKSGGQTVSSQRDVEKAMKNIASHLGGGWFVLGLQNQSSNQASPFAIGGGVANAVWANSSQQKYVHDHMVAMSHGNIPNDLLNTKK